MAGGLYLALYVFAGLCCTRFLLPRRSVLTRAWLGVSLGLLLQMWLPALLAFAVRFSILGHMLALIPLAGIVAGCYFLRDKCPVKPWDADETRLMHQLLMVALPLTLLAGYLQYTHCFRVGSDGGYWVGQSTYGDLPMHTSFVASLVNSSFPPEYAIFPGQQLSYPFLMDSLSTSLYMMGFSLQLSMILPGTLMMALCFMGVMILAREMTVGRWTLILAMLLFFLNGGLGFLYSFDMAGGVENDGTWTIVSRVQEILEGYYATPTNQPDTYNLQWSNVIADLMVPQRTLLGGWCMVIPCFYLLWSSFAPGSEHRGERTRAIVLLGVWGGLLPLIHTHSFTALALCSMGMLIYDLIHDQDRLGQLKAYVLYGGIAAVISIPQLFGFTFHQVFQEGAQGSGNAFLEFWFNWRNTAYASAEQQGTIMGMRDLYGWFYLKNIGLPFLFLLLALLEKDPRQRRIFSGALPIILAAELIRFQPNVYDNNKLLYLAWLLCCMIVANWCRKVWHKLAGLRGRGVLAAVTAVTVFLSGGLTLWRECVSNYQAFSPGAVEEAEFVRDNTDPDAVFMTGRHHLNPISSLAGRKIVCGPDLWLYFHGLQTTERAWDISSFYADPANGADILEKYGVDYICMSSYERSNYFKTYDSATGSYRFDYDLQAAAVAALDALYPRFFSNGEAIIWQVAPEAD